MLLLFMNRIQRADYSVSKTQELLTSIMSYLCSGCIFFVPQQRAQKILPAGLTFYKNCRYYLYN